MSLNELCVIRRIRRRRFYRVTTSGHAVGRNPRIAVPLPPLTVHHRTDFAALSIVAEPLPVPHRNSA